MDVERTMQFSLYQQAGFAVNLQQLQRQQTQFAANRYRFRQETEARFDKHQRQIKAIRILIRAGMKLLVEVQEQQKQTDAKLRALIDSLHPRSNGNSQ
jgi:hypothetical protein